LDRNRTHSENRSTASADYTAEEKEIAGMMYQLGWTTLPGLRGLSVSEFRAVPTSAPENEKDVAVSFNDQSECDSFLRLIEAEFLPRRFTNAADAFDTVKAWILDYVSKRPGGNLSGHKK
jgi:hypothetical protein